MQIAVNEPLQVVYYLFNHLIPSWKRFQNDGCGSKETITHFPVFCVQLKLCTVVFLASNATAFGMPGIAAAVLAALVSNMHQTFFFHVGKLQILYRLYVCCRLSLAFMTVADFLSLS